MLSVLIPLSFELLPSSPAFMGISATTDSVSSKPDRSSSRNRDVAGRELQAAVIDPAVDQPEIDRLILDADQRNRLRRIGKRNLPLGQPFDLLGKTEQGLQDRAGLHLDRVNHQLAGHVAGQRIGQRQLPPLQRRPKTAPWSGVTSASTGAMNFNASAGVTSRVSSTCRPPAARQARSSAGCAARRIDGASSTLPPLTATSTGTIVSVPSFSTALTAPRFIGMPITLARSQRTVACPTISCRPARAAWRRASSDRAAKRATARSLRSSPAVRAYGRHSGASRAQSATIWPDMSTSGVLRQIGDLAAQLPFDRRGGQLSAADRQRVAG